MMLMSLENLTY